VRKSVAFEAELRSKRLTYNMVFSCSADPSWPDGRCLSSRHWVAWDQSWGWSPPPESLPHHDASCRAIAGSNRYVLVLLDWLFQVESSASHYPAPRPKPLRMSESVRLAIYGSFVSRGRAPTVLELAATTGQSLASVRQSLLALHSSRDIVLSESALAAFPALSDACDTEAVTIVMAHPFTSVPLGFSAMGRDVMWWGGCAWDSFALPHLIPDQAPMLVATRCPSCETPLAFDVGSDGPPNGGPADAVAHFLVPTSHMWDDVVHTCGYQRIFCNERCVDSWLDRTGNNKGYVMSIQQLWRLASEWYAGRLDAGYKRREPAQAKDYFRAVGLQGDFWGLSNSE
jgi:hypothetical protein